MGGRQETKHPLTTIEIQVHAAMRQAMRRVRFPLYRFSARSLFAVSAVMRTTVP